jgi:hypothetical protein
MYRLDQLIEIAYSPAVEALKRQAAHCLRASLITGILALIIFAVGIFSLFGCFLLQINPIAHWPFLLGIASAIAAFLVLVASSWIYSIRHLILLRKIKTTIDSDMRHSIHGSSGAHPPA